MATRWGRLCQQSVKPARSEWSWSNQTNLLVDLLRVLDGIGIKKDDAKKHSVIRWDGMASVWIEKILPAFISFRVNADGIPSVIKLVTIVLLIMLKDEWVHMTGSDCTLYLNFVLKWFRKAFDSALMGSLSSRNSPSGFNGRKLLFFHQFSNSTANKRQARKSFFTLTRTVGIACRFLRDSERFAKQSI